MAVINYDHIIEICKRFNNTNPIDFYTLFNIDKSMNLMQINKDIKNKKIRIMFDMDYSNIDKIPVEYREKYIKITNSIPDLIDAFSTKENRRKYDEKLIASKPNRYDDEDDSKTIMITKVDTADLDKSIIDNAVKYGWNHSVNALVEFINTGNDKGFTRDNNTRENIQKLGKEKVKDMIIPSSFPDLDNNVKIDTEQMVVNYISKMLEENEVLKVQASALKNAITETMKKYDQMQVRESVMAYVNNENASGITNNMEARTNLKRFVRPSDVDFMLKAINNQERFANPTNYYFNTKSQSPYYQIDLFMYNTMNKANTNTVEDGIKNY